MGIRNAPYQTVLPIVGQETQPPEPPAVIELALSLRRLLARTDALIVQAARLGTLIAPHETYRRAAAVLLVNDKLRSDGVLLGEFATEPGTVRIVVGYPDLNKQVTVTLEEDILSSPGEVA